MHCPPAGSTCPAFGPQQSARIRRPEAVFREWPGHLGQMGGAGGVSVDLVRCPRVWSASSACGHAGAGADRIPSAALCILGARPPRWVTGMEVMGGAPTCPHKDARLLEPPPRNGVPQLCHARTPPNPCRTKLHPSAVPGARRVLLAPNPMPRCSRPTGRGHRTALGVQWWRIHLVLQWTRLRSPDRETKIPPASQL